MMVPAKFVLFVATNLLLALPLPAQESYVVQQSLTIGQAFGEDNYTLGRISAIASDASGRIFTADVQYTRVQVFDSAGAYLQTVGRLGDGPGEFRTPAAMALVDDNTLVISDIGQNAYRWLETNGQFTARIPIPARPHAIDVISGDGRGRVLDARRSRDRSIGSFWVVRYGVEESATRLVADSLLVPGVANTAIALSDPSSGRSYGSAELPFSPYAVWTSAANGVAYSVDGSYSIEWQSFTDDHRVLFQRTDLGEVRIPEELSLHVRDELVSTLERLGDRVRVNSASWVDQVAVPEFFPQVMRLLRDPFGRVWVLTADPSGKPALDAWTPDGSLLGRAVLDTEQWPDLEVMDVTGTHILGLFEDEFGAPQIRGFGIPPALRAR